MKIKIKVPKNDKKWKFSWTGHGRSFKRADTLFSGLERRLLRMELKEKLAILVKYDKDSSNESLSSKDTGYLLYTLGCFLEDYISPKTLKRIEKTYAIN